MRFMLIRIILPVVLLLPMAPDLNAATLNVVGGQLIGASNVNVDGSLYDVAFVDGTCRDLFAGCDENADFPWPGRSSVARYATQALLDQVFVDGSSGAFNTRPELTRGCESTVQCSTHTPYAVQGLAAFGIYTINSVDSNDLFSNFDYSTTDYTDHDWLNWAVWTPVPEPTTGLLIALGLIAMSACQGRKRPL